MLGDKILENAGHAKIQLEKKKRKNKKLNGDWGDANTNVSI